MIEVATMELPEPSQLLEIEDRLQARLSGRVRGLRVLVQDEGIVLQGFTRSYHAKQVAQQAIMEETNLPILANEIEVS